jgi:O-acetyl-ADP-ribose deacetylase (regulator of RNase III)
MGIIGGTNGCMYCEGECNKMCIPIHPAYNEVDGDLIKLAQRAHFDVIAHGCNCFCQMGAGIAPQMAKAFSCNDPEKYPGESTDFPDRRGDMTKLGNIESYSWYVFGEDGERRRLEVINAYTQHGFGLNHSDGSAIPLDYNALILCMKKINYKFKGKHIGLPLIGCGLAGGDVTIVKKIIQEELKDCTVTIVNYKK